MSDISQRMMDLVNHFANGNKSKFARMLDTDVQNINNYINGRKPSFEILQAIAKKFDINYNWLLTNRGGMLKDEKYNSAGVVSLEDKNIILVPLVDQYAYAGYMSGYNDSEYIDELPKFPFMDNLPHKGNYLCFEVRGDSMDNGTHESYLEGDIVLGREVPQKYWQDKLHFDKWDFIIVHESDGILIKRIVSHNITHGTIIARSLNNFYDDQIIDLRNIVKLFNVVDSRRKRNRR